MTEEIKPHKKPGRPPGVKNKQKTRPTFIKTPEQLYAPERVVEIKEKVLELFEEGSVINLSEAASLLMVPKWCLYSWSRHDKAFATALKVCNELVADRLEQSLWGEKSFIPRLMLLKGLRPQYKDAYRPVVETSDALERFLQKLEEADAKETAKPREQTADVRSAGVQADARTVEDS